MGSRDRDNEIVAKILLDGLIKFTLPTIALATAGTYLMRKRVSALKATPVESWLLTGMHYYAGMSVGATAGMWLFEPIFERKVLEQAPNSEIAQAIRADKRRSK